jgi:hypothetical protein
MLFDYQVGPSSPFWEFLQRASEALDLARTRIVPDQLCDEFTKNAEQRNFCADLTDRVARVAFAYDRLCELTTEYHDLQRQQDQARDEHGTYTFTTEMLKAEARWNVEVDLLTFYAYYELKSIIDILDQWGVKPESGSELEYAVKVRDRFLAHPVLCGVAPNAFRGKAIPCDGGMTRCDIASLNQWDPITRNAYLSRLRMAEPYNIDQVYAENAAIVRSKKRNESLTGEEVLRLKAFGMREPDLSLALVQLAQALMAALSQEFLACCEEAITRFGFERIPPGLDRISSAK